MKQYRFLVEYDGTHYHGWQIQPNANTIQAELEKAARIFLRHPVKIQGSGRTDTGVHARGQVASFYTELELDPLKAVRSFNGLLPQDIRVHKLEQCSFDFSPRYDALYRDYIYTVSERPSALLRNFSWDCSHLELNLSAMEKAATYFLGTHDFLAFSIPRHDGKPTDCNIFCFEITHLNKTLKFHIQGNRFLHRMVRSMVGLLIDIGKGRYQPEIIFDIFKGQQVNWTWAPARGLVLEKVLYADFS